jgi:choline dehydrogenase-like flavoprotein
MDNRQVLMPFVNLRMIGRQWEPQSYQYHQVASALQMDDVFVHSQITTLKTAMVHPIVQTIPGSLRAALALFRNMHAALGLLNINLHDVRRSANRLVLELDRNSKQTRLLAEYQPPESEHSVLRRVIKTYRKVLRVLGCVAPGNMTHIRPMGASVHYAGTIPMAHDSDCPTADEHCRSRDFENLYFVDGTTFPSLAAKNLTFTLMANAARVADSAF